jgi:hypothetical protein
MGSKKGYDENSYIQDGLVFQLDGINKGSNQGYWTDLKGGCTFTIPSADAVEVLDNCFKFYESANMPLASGTLAASGVGKTIEVVAQRINYHSSGDSVFSTAKGSTSGNILVSLGVSSTSQIVFLQRTKRLKCNFNWTNTRIDGQLATVVGRFSYNTDVACFNGAEAEFGAADYWTSNSIGVGYGKNVFYGKVFAIRIYDRHLSLAEMQFNQNIDLKRFGT